MKNNDFTKGKIVPLLLKFMIPVLFAMLLQAMYGAVDLMIVGQFGTNADVSGVSTGSQIVMTLTNLVIGLSMGVTVSVGQSIGRKRNDEAGMLIGTGLYIFFAAGVLFTAVGVCFSEGLAGLMHAPSEAFRNTVEYIRICSAGFIVVIAYNLLGSIFRGLGDSKTPLLAVGISCVLNILFDILFVAVLNKGAAGAATATVIAQFISVVISLLIISRKELPFVLSKDTMKFRKRFAGRIIRIGTPIALQDFLVGMSFLVLLAIVNGLGLIESAGVGVAEKVCAFIMLVPSAFMQSMSSFVAQNMGAGKGERAVKALQSGILVSCIFGAVMFYVTFFHGNLLAGIFTDDALTVLASWDYLKAYAIDCLLTCFLFCFIGYYNGIEKTKFVMLQGLVGAFFIRIPVAFLMRSIGNGSLFLIGIATPCSTVVQIAMCFIFFKVSGKNEHHIQEELS